MSEDAVRWMAAAATAAAALGDVVAQFGRYTGGDTARSSSDPDATPAPLSATQRAQFDRTCEREMPEWLRAAADAASLISDAAERLQYGSSHPASHPASRSGSRPSSRCAAEPTSTPKGRIAIINDTVDPAVSPSERQRLLEEAMVSAYEAEGAADAQAISRNLRGSLYNELGKVPQVEVDEDEMSPNTLKTFERAAAATHMGPIAYEAGCSAMRAMEAVSAAMEALDSLAAQEEHELVRAVAEAEARILGASTVVCAAWRILSTPRCERRWRSSAACAAGRRATWEVAPTRWNPRARLEATEVVAGGDGPGGAGADGGCTVQPGRVQTSRGAGSAPRLPTS
jgi:hypothetical protein